MCRIEHVAIYTHDIEKLASFYATYFGATVGNRYENEKKGFASRFLELGGGSRIEVMTSTALLPGEESTTDKRVGLAHLAFTIGSEADVNCLTDRLRNAGFPVVSEPRRTGDGYYESVILDPDANTIELCASRS